MIPTIGLMLGAYIFMRSVDMLLRPTSNTFLKLLAIASAGMAMIGALDLMLSGSRSIPGL